MSARWCKIFGMAHGINLLTKKFRQGIVAPKQFVKNLKRQGRLVKVGGCKNRKPSTELEWCQEAFDSHQQHLVTGIIASEEVKLTSGFQNELIVGSIGSLLDEPPNWWGNCQSSVRLSRSLEDYRQHLKLIFRYSSFLMFIDPYLNPDKTEYCQFCELLASIDTERNSNKDIKIEIHVSLSKLNPNQYRKGFKNLAIQLKEKSLGFRESKTKIHAFLWEDFHDRHLISNWVGISLPHGFGIDGHKETTWSRYDRAVCDSIQKEFDRNSRKQKLIQDFDIASLLNGV
ncbi:MAG: hypothetical protein HC838_09290 [Spirulinaceae cyanobacterium RM2_2_10]|nr:hypothetical protein [Spirulinaceae cyanobacterium RM2_2_10]